MEFNEFLPMLWLDFLMKNGVHNDTFTSNNLDLRINQFLKLVKYDHKSDSYPSLDETYGIPKEITDLESKP